MLDVNYQAMEMMAAMMAKQSVPNPGGGGVNKADGKSDFDSMVEQKQQQVKDKQPQKTDTDTAKDKAEPNAKDEAVPDEQYAVVAALMLQVQPEIEYIAPTLDAAEESAQVLEIGPVLPEVEAAVQDTAQDTAGQAVMQVTEQAADIPVEEAVASVEIAPQETQNDLQQHETGHSAPQEGQVRVQREDGPAPEDVRWEAPVFGNVSAAPVKVAPPQEEPIEIESPNAAEDLAGRIEDLLDGEGIDSRVEFTLVPESLGKITVQITRGVDGTLHVLLNATTERAAAMLERHSSGLQNLLAANGRSQTHVEVRANEESHRQFFNPNGENNQGRQQQQQRQPKQQHSGQQTQDFVQQLRLGLIGRDSGE